MNERSVSSFVIRDSKAAAAPFSQMLAEGKVLVSSQNVNECGFVLLKSLANAASGVTKEALGDGVRKGIKTFVESLTKACVILQQEAGLLCEFGEREGEKMRLEFVSDATLGTGGVQVSIFG